MSGKHSKFVYFVNVNDLEIIEFINRRIDECAPAFKPALITSPYVDKGIVYRMKKEDYVFMPITDWGIHEYDERSDELKEMIRPKVVMGPPTP